MRARLKTKAEELCSRVVEVDPRHTSQTCPECGHVEQNNRKTQADFECQACGFTEHADTVGAINVLRRGMSAGALPAAGRGGLATGPALSGAGAERAEDPSNKSRREPVETEGSHRAKPYSVASIRAHTGASRARVTGGEYGIGVERREQQVDRELQDPEPT